MARLQAILFRKSLCLDFKSVVIGHHIYKKEWKPVVGEALLCHYDTREEAKLYDDCAIGIYLHGNSKCHEKLAVHSPLELSFLLCKFIEREGCSLTFSQTGPRVLEDGLVVPGTYTALCTSRRPLETLEEQLRKKTLAVKHLKVEIGSIKTKNMVN